MYIFFFSFVHVSVHVALLCSSPLLAPLPFSSDLDDSAGSASVPSVVRSAAWCSAALVRLVVVSAPQFQRNIPSESCHRDARDRIARPLASPASPPLASLSAHKQERGYGIPAPLSKRGAELISPTTH